MFASVCVLQTVSRWYVCVCVFQTVEQMWPYVGQFVEKLFRQTIEPAVRQTHGQLSSFCFTTINLGDKVRGQPGR